MIKGFWGKKIGMTQVFSGNKAIPATVIDTACWFVTQVKTIETDGYSAVQVGRLRKRYERDSFDAQWLEKPKVYFGFVREIHADGIVEGVQKGQPANFSELFALGAAVDVRGITKGCGFQGVMKRHGFSGGGASHGSKTGRRPGSIGFIRTAGKVIKGKKMPGHMGVEQRVSENLEILKIEKDQNIVVVKGSVPGKAGSLVFVCNRVKA
ncbi:50S ribosomal protein L3 [bacterium]|nr:50S ribosomal protein L3 [bacterium]